MKVFQNWLTEPERPHGPVDIEVGLELWCQLEGKKGVLWKDFRVHTMNHFAILPAINVIQTK